MAAPGTINHDTAARLIGVAPGELDALVKAGAVRRADRNAYQLPVLVQDYIGHLKAERERAELAPKQAEVAEHLDLSERSVREFLVSAGLDHKAETLSSLRIAYIRRLREMAAGRAADGDLDLATERAQLARSQRLGHDIKNNVALGSYAPIELLSDVLANAAQAVVDRLEQIPADLRRVCPDLPQAARDAVMAEIASARNEMVRKTASLVADAIDPADQLEDEEPLLEESDA